MRLILLGAVTATLQACATVGGLPQSASEVAFDDGLVGKQGWSRYEDSMFVPGISRNTAFAAAKDALASTNFVVKRGDREEGFVIGQHGMTATDWNIVAGVYFRASDTGYDFKVISQGSYDVGFMGDATARSWPQLILAKVRAYVERDERIGRSDDEGDNIP